MAAPGLDQSSPVFVQIFPNPSAELVRVSWDDVPDGAKVVLLNDQGIELLRSSLRGQNPGQYLIQVLANGQTHTYRVLKE